MSGCSDRRQNSLTISAASSLTKPLAQVLEAYDAQGAPVRTTLNIGSSGALAQQIINGARVDVYISANQNWIEKLKERDLIAENTETVFLKNELILAVSSESNYRSAEDLFRSSGYKLALGTPESAPVGEYAIKWLKNSGNLERTRSHLVFLKNEQQVLRAIIDKHATAGIIYKSSHIQSDRIKILEIPDPAMYPSVRYSIAILKASGNLNNATALVAFLKGPVSKKIWLDLGFQVVE